MRPRKSFWDRWHVDLRHIKLKIFYTPTVIRVPNNNLRWMSEKTGPYCNGVQWDSAQRILLFAGFLCLHHGYVLNKEQPVHNTIDGLPVCHGENSPNQGRPASHIQEQKYQVPNGGVCVDLINLDSRRADTILIKMGSPHWITTSSEVCTIRLPQPSFFCWVLGDSKMKTSSLV